MLHYLENLTQSLPTLSNSKYFHPGSSFNLRQHPHVTKKKKKKTLRLTEVKWLARDNLTGYRPSSHSNPGPHAVSTKLNRPSLIPVGVCKLKERVYNQIQAWEINSEKRRVLITFKIEDLMI